MNQLTSPWTKTLKKIYPYFIFIKVLLRQMQNIQGKIKYYKTEIIVLKLEAL